MLLLWWVVVKFEATATARLVENYGTGTLSASYPEASDHGLSAFLDMLTHDDRASFYHVSRYDPKREGGGTWRDVTSRGKKRIGELVFDDDHDWFITRHGFNSSKRRSSSYCRQLNSMLCDIDFHGEGDDHVHLSATAMELLDAAWKEGELPEPTMAVFTGRGLHLYYAMESSTATRRANGEPNKAGTAYFHDVQDKLANAIEAYLQPIMPQARIDKSVSDDARVSRVPGTVNQKNGERCRVVRSSGIYHKLKGLNSAVSGKSARKKEGKPHGKATYRRRGKNTQLSKMRMDAIEVLQESRSYDSEGTRELMCFCYYNAAVQVFEDRTGAAGALDAFNARFKAPVDDAEVANIIRSVDKVGFYKLSSRNINDKLMLTDQEAESFFSTKRQAERRRAKELTARKRNRRNAKIRFIKAMKVDDKTIASEIGCCERTVKNVLNSSRAGEPGALDLDEATRLVLAYRNAGITTKKDTADNIFPQHAAMPAGTARGSAETGGTEPRAASKSPPRPASSQG